MSGRALCPRVASGRLSSKADLGSTVGRAAMSPAVSQNECPGVPVAFTFLRRFFPFVFLLHFIPPVRAWGLTGAVVKRVNGDRHGPAAERPWPGTEHPAETAGALQCEGRGAESGVASRRPRDGWSLDQIGLMLHTPHCSF